MRHDGDKELVIIHWVCSKNRHLATTHRLCDPRSETRELIALLHPHRWPTWLCAERTARLWCRTQRRCPAQRNHRKRDERMSGPQKVTWPRRLVDCAWRDHLCPPVVLFGNGLITLLTSRVPAQETRAHMNQNTSMHVSILSTSSGAI